jgi:predicted nucleic acid-binding protein
MPGDVFVDANILVYAHDRDAGVKHAQARQRVAELWQAETMPWVSVQVLQEFFVNLHRKGVPLATSRSAVQDYSKWRVVENTVALLNRGLSEMERWQLSFWDGLILAAARQAGVSTLWTEDLSEGQDYGGICVVNPLK